jgi:hypothetical protein
LTLAERTTEPSRNTGPDSWGWAILARFKRADRVRLLFWPERSLHWSAPVSRPHRDTHNATPTMATTSEILFSRLCMAIVPSLLRRVLLRPGFLEQHRLILGSHWVTEETASEASSAGGSLTDLRARRTHRNVVRSSHPHAILESPKLIPKLVKGYLGRRGRKT